MSVTNETSRSASAATVRADEEATYLTPGARRWLAIGRIALGFVFLWAFLDKLFGLGYSTPSARAWIQGGSPTRGFLSNVEVGPFANFFHAIAGNIIIDWLFMLGLLGIGVAFILGIGLRVAAIANAIMMIMMWAAEWPLATKTLAGEPSGSTNPLVDYHIIYALLGIAVALTGAGLTWGLGRMWQNLSFVRKAPWLR